MYDKFAQEQTIENLLMSGLLTSERINELELYGELLDDDATAPKIKIQEAAKRIRENQQKIAEMQSRAQMMGRRAEMFLNGDPDTQASLMADSVMKMRQGVKQSNKNKALI